jgi:3-oxoacyl-[acyl-carrier protein] reductase
MRFKNKVVLVTGSSKGIGKATALEFAKEGAKLVINYLNSEKEANEVVNKIKKISDAIAIKCDVSDEKQVKEMFEKIIKKFGKIDVLVNNAGVVYDVPFFERTIKQWKRTIDVDLFGVYICSRYASIYMKKQKYGKIINISSSSAINTNKVDSIDYAAAKAGVINLTNTLAKELGPEIQVNCISPGWINTSLNVTLPKKFLNREKKRIYLKRFAEPEEVAKVILFLASDDASFVNGVNFLVDGGYQ